MARVTVSLRAAASAGFTLVEMIVVIFLLALAMLGLLAVFDAGARINKSESDVADAQSAVRQSVYRMTRAIRLAGTGGLFVTQAVLNAPDPQLSGITIASANGYDNVTGATVTDMAGNPVPVKDGTDMIEIRGVINSPLLGFDGSAGNGCGTCTGSLALTAKATTNNAHPNNDANREPQFAAIDAYTAGASASNPFLVIVSANDDIHGGCSTAFGPQLYPQPSYNVGVITAKTQLVASSTFGPVNFGAGPWTQFNPESPEVVGAAAAPITTPLARAGIVDDLIYFIDNSDPLHPALAQGTRHGTTLTQFSVVPLADDVEDMQVAYGVDINGDNTVGRTSTPSPGDPDLNVSIVAGADKWVPNVTAESPPYTNCQFQSAPLVPLGCPAFPHGGQVPAAHCPRLHGVMISLVAKSKDSDPTYRAPNANGFRIMNAAITPVAGQYRRRIQTLKINLRNYAFEGFTPFAPPPTPP